MVEHVDDRNNEQQTRWIMDPVSFFIWLMVVPGAGRVVDPEIHRPI